MNESFKLLVFLMNLVLGVEEGRPASRPALELARAVVRSLLGLDPEKLLFLAKHLFLGLLLEEIERKNGEKREKMIEFLGFFLEKSEAVRKEVLGAVVLLARDRAVLRKVFERLAVKEKGTRQLVEIRGRSVTGSVVSMPSIARS